MKISNIKNYPKIILNKYPVRSIAKPTIPKNIPISFTLKTLFKIIASGKLKATTAIIKESAVPSNIPFCVKTSTSGKIPAAFEYIGIPIITATIGAYQTSQPAYLLIKSAGIYP